MKLCPNCGREWPESNNFCTACGTPLTLPQAVSLPTDDTASEPLPAQSVATEGENAKSALKSVAASPIFLTVLILLSADFLLSLTILPRIASEVRSSLLSNLFGQIDYYEAFLYANISRGIIYIASAIGLLFSLILLLSLWYTYASAKRSSSTGVKTGGLSTLKVLYIIQFVSCVIFILLLILLFILLAIVFASELFSSADMYYEEPYYGIFGGILFVFLAVMLLLVLAYDIFFFIKLIKTINVAKEAAHGRVGRKKPSRFLGVTCFLGAGSSFFTSLSMLVTALSGRMSYDAVYSENTSLLLALSSLIGCASYFLFGWLLFEFRKKLIRK